MQGFSCSTGKLAQDHISMSALTLTASRAIAAAAAPVAAAAIAATAPAIAAAIPTMTLMGICKQTAAAHTASHLLQLWIMEHHGVELKHKTTSTYNQGVPDVGLFTDDFSSMMFQ
jgi:hypothetical protein